jgi:hypothetical protein
MKLYVPVGLDALKSVYEENMRLFPPGAPIQPPLVPAVDSDRAAKVARTRFTVTDPFAGYVTALEVDDVYGARFFHHPEGSGHNGELRIAADELAQFNSSIREPIAVTSGVFGPQFKGYVPELFNFAGRDALGQLTMLSNLLFYSRMDFIGEVHANNLAVFLHFPFWATCDLAETDISDDRRMSILSQISKIWSKEFPRLPNIDPGGFA